MGTFAVHKKLLADAEKITELYQSNLSIKEIAKIEEVSVSTIALHLESMGLRIRKLRGGKSCRVNARYHYYEKVVEKSKELQAQHKINSDINRKLVKRIKTDSSEDARMIHYICGLSV